MRHIFRLFLDSFDMFDAGLECVENAFIHL